MCTCIEDLYNAEIRVPLGPTVLLGVGALLVYRIWKFVAAAVQDDEESVMTDETDSDDESDATEDPVSAALTTAQASFRHSKVENEHFDQAADPDIFSDDDDPSEYEVSPAEYEVSLIDAPTPGPDVISSTEEASSDTALPSPETAGTPSGSSPPDAV